MYICLSAGLACQNPPIRFHRLVSYCLNRCCYDYLMLLPAKIGTKLGYDHHLPLLWSRPPLPSPAAPGRSSRAAWPPPVFVACKSSDFSRKSLKPEAEIPVPVALEAGQGFHDFRRNLSGWVFWWWRSMLEVRKLSWMGDQKLTLKKFNCYNFFWLDWWLI